MSAKESFLIETAKIVGASSAGCWSQVHTFFPEDVEKKEKRGGLLAVLVIKEVSEGVEAVAVGREILGRLHEEYYGNLEGSAFEGLGKAVEKVCRESKNLEITAVSVLGDVLYLAVCGQGKVVLIREKKTGLVLAGEEGALVKTASGYIQNNDFFLIGSKAFFKTVAEGVLRAVLESGSPNEAVEILAPIILGRDDLPDAAAVLSQFKKEEKPAIEPMAETETVPTEIVKETVIRTETKTSFIKNIFAKIKFPPAKKLFVRRPPEGRRKKLYLVAAFVLAAVLIGSLIIGLKNGSKNKENGFVNPSSESR